MDPTKQSDALVLNLKCVIHDLKFLRETMDKFLARENKNYNESDFKMIKKSYDALISALEKSKKTSELKLHKFLSETNGI